MNIFLNSKKEETKKITNTRELADYILEKGKETNKMSDEEKAKKDAQILAKLKAGKNYRQKNWIILEEPIQ